MRVRLITSLTAIFLFVLTSVCLAEFPNEPNGYAGVSWGTAPSEIAGLTYNETKDNQDFYIRKVDDGLFYIGTRGFKEHLELWVFKNDAFIGVIAVSDRQTGQEIVKYAKSYFGEPTKTYKRNTYLCHQWRGDVTEFNADYAETGKNQSFFGFISRKDDK